MSQSPSRPAGPLKGIRILELASVLAGPMAGTELARLGAVVTKVERPPHGDVTRSWRTATEPPIHDADGRPASAYYMAANRGKRIAWVDLATAEGKDWLEDALASHDVVVQNFKEADLAKFNLTPSALSTCHPHLVHVRLIGFRGQPDRLAYDVVVQAETGWMHMNGAPPTRMPVALMDVLASHSLTEAILAGLFSRERDAHGRGTYSEIALEDCGIAALANQATNHLIGGASPGPSGNEHPNIAPYGDLLACTDGHVVLAVGSDRQFAGLCTVLDLGELTTDSRFQHNVDRLSHRRELVAALQTAAAGWRKVDLERALRQAGVPAGVVRTLPEVFAKPTGPFASLQH